MVQKNSERKIPGDISDRGAAERDRIGDATGTVHKNCYDNAIAAIACASHFLLFNGVR